MSRQPYRTTVTMWAIGIHDSAFHKAAWSTVGYSLYANKSEAQSDIDSFKIKGEPLRVRITIQRAMPND
jgi:hypothetical protein